MELLTELKSDNALTSCLLPEADRHFRMREEQLMQLERESEDKRQRAPHTADHVTLGSEVVTLSSGRASKTLGRSSSARAHSASPAFRPREGLSGISDHQRVQSESSSVRRAQTAGVKHCCYHPTESEFSRGCSRASTPLTAADANATAGGAQKHSKEYATVRQAVLTDSYVACGIVGGNISEEYSAVFHAGREAASENLCKADGTGRDRDALAAALESQHNRMLVLQQELSARLKETQSLTEELFECKSQKQALECENEKLRDKVEQLLVKAERAESSHAEVLGKLETLEKAVNDLTSEYNKLTKSAQKCASELKTKEGHLQRVTEEAAALRETLKDSKKKTKDSSAVLQKECEKLGAENKRLLSERNELVQGFKKQMKLIDVLKRQKAHMEAARLLSFSEDEFLRMLRIE